MNETTKKDLWLGAALWFCLIAAAMGLFGCVLSSLTSTVTADNIQQLSPEQIKALQAAGQDVYACIFVAGPPPAGRIQYIVIPHGAAFTARFANQCEVVQ